MLIRNEQMLGMRRARHAARRAQTIEFLRREFPDQTSALTSGQLTAYVDYAIDRALEYEIKTGEAFARFAVLVLLCGPTLHADPLTHQYLSNRNIDPDTKLRDLMERVVLNLERLSEPG